MVFSRVPGRSVVDRPGDLGSVQPPAGGYRQTIEEALGAPVDLPERMQIVDLVIVLGQPFDEPVPFLVLHVAVLAELIEDETGRAGDHRHSRSMTRRINGR